MLKSSKSLDIDFSEHKDQMLTRRECELRMCGVPFSSEQIPTNAVNIRYNGATGVAYVPQSGIDFG
jgi:hypothetical protein